jgi:cysteine synthase A
MTDYSISSDTVMTSQIGLGATIHDGILSTIGNTPLIRLHHALNRTGLRLFGKLEALNPGGSVKDRPAWEMIRRGLETGAIRPDTVIIESSSGNMAIGLAQACRYLNLRFICVVDRKTTAQNLKILQAYGAEMDLVSEPDPATGEYLPARLARVQWLLKSIRNSFWPNQYANQWNASAHRHGTMPEIVNALGQDIDYLFCATGTCGTVTGCAEYVHEQGLKTKVIAVDAVGSVIFGGPKAKRLIPGHGAGIKPSLCREELIERCIHVSDLDCVIGCRRLLKHEAILLGGSSGGVLTAVAQMQREIASGATCVLILADRGERYLDTIYSDTWVKAHFGHVPELDSLRVDPAELTVSFHAAQLMNA